MTRDPYKTLGLSHNATASQIKAAYRKLALLYHPDRLTRRNATPEQMQVATAKFAEVSSAYALLSDERRKKEYDHIYKYGGFDDVDEKKSQQRRTAQPTTFHPPTGRARPSRQPFQPFDRSSSQKGKSTGIGYVVSDPFAFILSQGKCRSAAVAGIEIPSRMHFARPAAGGGGFRIAFSSGKYIKASNGARTSVSKTTQFVHGKKFSRVETTTVHPDGRKEVVIEGDDYVQRRVSSPPKRKSKVAKDQEDVAQKEEPWYMYAWNGIRDKLSMCYNPCAAVTAQ